MARVKGIGVCECVVMLLCAFFVHIETFTKSFLIERGAFSGSNDVFDDGKSI